MNCTNKMESSGVKSVMCVGNLLMLICATYVISLKSVLCKI